MGYPLDEAQELLAAEAVSFIVKFTAPPGKFSSEEEAVVIAVRQGSTIEIICASPDWTVT